MLDYIIESNTQAAAQGNSWQDGVNALVMLWKQAIQSIHELSWTVVLKTFRILMKITTQVRKSSKMGPHLGHILLKRPHFPHCKAFDLQVRKAIFRLWKHCLLTIDL